MAFAPYEWRLVLEIRTFATHVSSWSSKWNIACAANSAIPPEPPEADDLLLSALSLPLCERNAENATTSFGDISPLLVVTICCSFSETTIPAASLNTAKISSSMESLRIRVVSSPSSLSITIGSFFSFVLAYSSLVCPVRASKTMCGSKYSVRRVSCLNTPKQFSNKSAHGPRASMARTRHHC